MASLSPIQAGRNYKPFFSYGRNAYSWTTPPHPASRKSPRTLSFAGRTVYKVMVAKPHQPVNSPAGLFMTHGPRLPSLITIPTPPHNDSSQVLTNFRIKHRHDHAVNEFHTTSKNNNTMTNHPTGENLSEFMTSEPFKVKDHKDSAPNHAMRAQTRKAGDPPASSNTSINFEARGRTGP